MFVDEILDFKSLNMGRELAMAGEFIYDSTKKDYVHLRIE